MWRPRPSVHPSRNRLSQDSMRFVKIGALTVLRHLNEPAHSFPHLLTDLSDIRHRRCPQNVKNVKHFKMLTPLYCHLCTCLVCRHTQSVPVAARSKT